MGEVSPSEPYGLARMDVWLERLFDFGSDPDRVHAVPWLRDPEERRRTRRWVAVAGLAALAGFGCLVAAALGVRRPVVVPVLTFFMAICLISAGVMLIKMITSVRRR